MLPEPQDDLQLDIFAQEVDDGVYSGVDQAAAGAETGWWDHGMRTIDELARTRQEFVPDDVTDLIGAPDHHNRVGALFAAASRAGIIEPVAMRRSTKPSRHAARVCVWRGVAT